MNYQVVFDLSEAGYKSASFLAFGLIFVVLGTLLVALRLRLPSRSGALGRRTAWTFFFLAFAVLWSSVVFATTYHQYLSMLGARTAGSYQVVEGPVTGFTPMPVNGHAMERFCVREQCFEYSDFVVSAGFNNTRSYGGPIREGLPVRVTYVGGTIIRLEVAK